LWLSFAQTGWSASAVRMGYGDGSGGGAYRLVRSRHIVWVFQGSGWVGLLVCYRNHGLRWD
jgi:hypothetical protein